MLVGVSDIVLESALSGLGSNVVLMSFFQGGESTSSGQTILSGSHASVESRKAGVEGLRCD